MILRTTFMIGLILTSFIFAFSQTQEPKIVRPKKAASKLPTEDKKKYDVPMLKLDAETSQSRAKMGPLPGISGEALVKKNENGKTSIAVEFLHNKENKFTGTAVLWIVTKAGMFTKVGKVPEPNEKNVSGMVTNVELDELGLLVTIEEGETEQPKGEIYGAFSPQE